MSSYILHFLVELVHGRIHTVSQDHLYSFAGSLLRLFHKLTFIASESAKYMICQIPSFWFGSDTNLDTNKRLCTKLLNDMLDSIVPTGTAFLTDTKLSRFQINIVINLGL